MAAPVTPYSAVSAAPPTVPESIIAGVIEHQYGLVGRFTPLVSERDQNFRLASDKGGDYVVKVTSLAETPLANAFRAAVLRHLEDIGMPGVPTLVCTRGGTPGGELEYQGQCYALRVVRYLAGDLLTSVPIGPALARDFGSKLAAFDTALGGFRHAGESPSLLWDLQRVTELRDLFDFIDDAEICQRVARAIDDFESSVIPQLKALRTQVIHGDANPENILVAPSQRSVSGFIDFGDMLRAPLVFEVAIAAAYLRAEGMNALELIVPFVSGYHAALPLTDVELQLLYDLVRARLATTLTLLYWRLGARDHDDLYRQKTLQGESDAGRFLAALDTLGRQGFLQTLRQGL